MENRAHAFAAGLFVLLLGLATALAVWYFAGSRERSDTYILETQRNVTGLNLEAQVLYRGIRAGKVVAIAPDPKNPRVILVTISLDANYRLSTAATAELGYQGITAFVADPCAVKDQRVRVKVEVTDQNGLTASGQADIQPTWTGTCP